MFTWLEKSVAQKKRNPCFGTLVGCILLLCVGAKCADLRLVHLQTELLGRNFGATDILLLLIPTPQFSFTHLFWYKHLKINGDWGKDFHERLMGVGTSICWSWEMSVKPPLCLLKISSLRHILKEIYYIQTKIPLFMYEHWIQIKMYLLESWILWINIGNYLSLRQN